MSTLLFLWGILIAICGFLLFASARSAIHEIEAGLAFVIATVAIGCGAIVYQLKENGKEKNPKPEPQDY